MKKTSFDYGLQFSIFVMAAWFYGNLYEEVVIAPNQVINSFETLKHFQGFFHLSSPMYFYVPFTQLAVVISSILFFRSQEETQRRLLRKASVFGLLAILITIPIVTLINMKIYFGDLEENKSSLLILSWAWLIGNLVRLFLVGLSLHYLIQAYLLRKIISK